MCKINRDEYINIIKKEYPFITDMISLNNIFNQVINNIICSEDEIKEETFLSYLKKITILNKKDFLFIDIINNNFIENIIENFNKLFASKEYIIEAYNGNEEFIKSDLNIHIGDFNIGKVIIIEDGKILDLDINKTFLGENVIFQLDNKLYYN